MDTSVPPDQELGRTVKLISEGRVRKHHLDWQEGFFSSSQIRQMVRIAWKHGFDVDFRHSGGAVFATFTKEDWWRR